MTVPIEELAKLALSVSSEELWQIIKNPHPYVLSNAVFNKNLTEDMAVFIAKKRTTSSDTLAFLANDIRFKDCYNLKLALCKNPKTPQRIVLSILKFLKIFDLADISRDRCVHINIRQKITHMLSDKITALPSGVRIALAKRADSEILIKLIEKSDLRVIQACLDSPLLTEGHICKLINRQDIKPYTIQAIAYHPKWSLRYMIRFALIRNFYTPMNIVTAFLSSMKTNDLRYLYSDPDIPKATRPYIHQELVRRKEGLFQTEDETFILSEDDDMDIKENLNE